MVEALRDCEGSYGQIHQRLKEKRLAWWGINKDRLKLSGTIPEQAYQLAMLEYLGLDPKEVPVVYRDETRITWRSFNFCPVIEACERLGLDTRVVCKEGFEESKWFKWSCSNGSLVGRGKYEKDKQLVIMANLPAIKFSDLNKEKEYYMEIIQRDKSKGFWEPKYGAEVSLDDNNILKINKKKIYLDKSPDVGNVFFRIWNGIKKIDDLEKECDDLKLRISSLENRLMEGDRRQQVRRQKDLGPPAGMMERRSGLDRRNKIKTDSHSQGQMLEKRE